MDRSLVGIGRGERKWERDGESKRIELFLSVLGFVRAMEVRN